MKLLRKIFGPSQEEVWRQLAREIGGRYVDGGFWHGDKVQAKVGEWTVTLDTYTVSAGHSHVTYTRLRAPYVNPDGFRFRIYRKGFFSELGKKLGMQDVEVGDAQFDEAFVIQGNEESKLRSLLAEPSLLRQLSAQPQVHLEVKDDEGFFGPSFPDGVDELLFQVLGVIKDVALLRSLFELFASTLNRLCHMGSAYENDPQLEL
jgi:hypothetical protein